MTPLCLLPEDGSTHLACGAKVLVGQGEEGLLCWELKILGVLQNSET